MTIEDFKALLAEQLFTPQGRRNVLKANEVPDYQASEHGIDIEAIDGIVVPTIEAQGYWAVNPVKTMSQGLRIFGQVQQNGECVYMFVRWHPPSEDIPYGAFNPFTQVELAAVPPADPKYLEGKTPGIRQ